MECVDKILDKWNKEKDIEYILIHILVYLLSLNENIKYNKDFINYKTLKDIGYILDEKNNIKNPKTKEQIEYMLILKKYDNFLKEICEKIF